MNSKPKSADWALLSDEELFFASDKYPQAFEILIDRYKDRLIGKAVGLLGDLNDAEDAAQEAFVSIYLHRGQFKNDGEANFHAWAYKILVNKCFTLYKKRKRHRDAFVALTPEMEEVLKDTGEEKNQKGILDRDEILSYLSLMPDKTSQIIKKILAGFTYQEIAETEALETVTIRSRIHRAKKELSKKVKLMNI